MSTIAFILCKNHQDSSLETEGSEGTNNPIATLSELQSSSMERGETSRRKTISAAIHQSVARQKPLPAERRMAAGLVFAKRNPEVSKILRNKILWSDEPKIDLFAASCRVDVSAGAGTERLIKIEGTMTAALYRDVLGENLLGRAVEDWGNGSSFSGTITSSTQPRYQTGGFSKTL